MSRQDIFPTPLIGADVLSAWLGRVVLIDVSFDLADGHAGEAAYRSAHLPGAFYAHLERDLSAAKTGRNGRHPLPTREAFAATVGAMGIRADTPVVVYDRQGGMFAARAWWMLRWLGHRAVALLDGGLPTWQALGYALDSGPGPVVASMDDAGLRICYPLSAEPGMPTLDADAVQAGLHQHTLIDARAPARFRGDIEPLDPVAGHIPGALNRPFQDNLAVDGRFLSAGQLKAAFDALWARTGDLRLPVVHQCGSGVTACHNLLAMAVAGFGDTALYPGSWSEWCADPTRPVRTCGVSIGH
ncbi:MAG: sulfurtransferase [Leptothrix ochracea]|uniref:sulfurtransferase n=1 Tax=Leptothrix ochracea TaxID=735331 RepID=UPI0034E1AA77